CDVPPMDLHSFPTRRSSDLGNVAAAPGDADLGEQQILKRVEGYQPFTISAGAPFYWTSNVALTRSGEQSDFVVAPAVAAFYEPRSEEHTSELQSRRDLVCRL